MKILQNFHLVALMEKVKIPKLVVPPETLKNLLGCENDNARRLDDVIIEELRRMIDQFNPYAI
ncbi:hypothetical protein ACS0TY_027298 [Phlomoides rotata]